jgi:hypothetical protein
MSSSNDLMVNDDYTDFRSSITTNHSTPMITDKKVEIVKDKSLNKMSNSKTNAEIIRKLNI